eukprot:3238143-Prymnesium_polylepis.1
MGETAFLFFGSNTGRSCRAAFGFAPGALAATRSFLLCSSPLCKICFDSSSCSDSSSSSDFLRPSWLSKPKIGNSSNQG